MEEERQHMLSRKQDRKTFYMPNNFNNLRNASYSFFRPLACFHLNINRIFMEIVSAEKFSSLVSSRLYFLEARKNSWG